MHLKRRRSTKRTGNHSKKIFKSWKGGPGKQEEQRTNKKTARRQHWNRGGQGKGHGNREADQSVKKGDETKRRTDNKGESELEIADKMTKWATRLRKKPDRGK